MPRSTSVSTGSGSVERIYTEIKARAIAFRFHPGERLNEVALAREFETSRTPLREALNRLVAEGFLTWMRRRGYVVRLLDAKEVFDLYEFRCALEVAAVRLACERATDDELDGIEQFLRASGRNVDEGETLRVLQLDEEFHERLMALSHNAEMGRVLRNVNARIRFVRWIDMQNGRRSVTQSEHRAVVRALKRRDADHCVRQLHDHITHRLDQISEVIREGYARIYTGASLASQAEPSTTAGEISR